MLVDDYEKDGSTRTTKEWEESKRLAKEILMPIIKKGITMREFETLRVSVPVVISDMVEEKKKSEIMG